MSLVRPLSWGTLAFAPMLGVFFGDDLTPSTTLLADGARHRPLGWEGSARGGHHRKGILRFAAVTPLPQVVELQIRRGGESAPGSFAGRR